MNSQLSATTGMSPFYADTGREPRVPFNIALLGADSVGRVETVEQRIAKLLQIRDDVMDASRKAKWQMKKHADKGRREADTYLPGELVWVDSSVFQREHGDVGEAAALRKPWAGPYRVIAVTDRGNVRLDLQGRRSHDEFHPEKLRRFMPSPAIFDARRTSELSCDVDEEGEEHWEVQEILDRKFNIRSKTWEYLVHWKGMAAEQSQWLPEANLSNCRESVDEFNSAYKGAERLQRERKRQSSEPDPDSGKQAKRNEGARHYSMRASRPVNYADNPSQHHTPTKRSKVATPPVTRTHTSSRASLDDAHGGPADDLSDTPASAGRDAGSNTIPSPMDEEDDE